MINGGPLSEDDARQLRSAGERLPNQAQKLLDLEPNKDDPVFATITGYDATTGAYSWYERYFDTNGLSTQLSSGLSGTPTNNPLYAYGDGSILSTLPTDAVIYPRTVHPTKGQIWETPVYCACYSGVIAGSGGSGGGSTIEVGCCPGVRIPTTLNLTFRVASGTCACIGSTVYPLTVTSTTLPVTWSGSGSVGDGDYSFALSCGFITPTGWGLIIGGTCVRGMCCLNGSIVPLYQSVTCSPFSFVQGPYGIISCAGAVIEAVITA